MTTPPAPAATPATDPAPPPVLHLEGVRKVYGGFTAVKDLDLTVPRGRIFGFLGPNGAGKTTTIRMVAGILKPTAGRIRVDGIDLSESPGRAKARVGYIPDRPFLYEKLSGVEFLRFVAALWGREGAETERRIDRFLELFSLEPWRHELIESYSHGMRQKLLIASAFLHDPALIVVDEPMVGLDPRAARLLKDLLRSYVDGGGTIFLSTHTLEVAEALCDRIAILSAGEIIAQGSMAELREQADAGGAGLEEIFLKVTGGEAVADLVGALEPPAPAGTS
ncbi:MAG: ABC transporter ATP-binding protein [Gemmatimonadales bacterium]|nr:MAG: ABC transporter ATP-binding protein [Gemmatimonadales bacterium]